MVVKTVLGSHFGVGALPIVVGILVGYGYGCYFDCGRLTFRSPKGDVPHHQDEKSTEMHLKYPNWG